MLTTIINLILIQLILVFLIDLSGAMNSLKMVLSKWLTKGTIESTNYRIKPLDCSLCMTFWVGLIYLFAIHSLTLPLAGLVCLLAFLTPVASDALRLVKDLITKLINWIYKLI